MAKIFHIVSNSEWGGGEQYVYDLAQRQLDDGFAVEIVCKPVDIIVSKFKNLGVQVHTMKLNGILDLASAFRLKKVLPQSEICYIHAHNFKDAFTAAYAKKLSGNKDVHAVMCRHLTRPGKNYAWLYRQLDFVCFDSELARDTFLSTNPKIDANKIRVIHTSITIPKEIADIDIRKELNIADGTVVAMYHGRLDAEKGINVLIEATEILKDKNFKLVLIGRGSDEYTSEIKSLIAEKGLNDKIILAGFKHPVLPYVAKADFGILASTVREGCPLSPQEYMSQGHPVVATNHGGQKEYIIDNENGLLVPPNDSQALAVAMQRLIDNSEIRNRLGKQAKADFENKLNYEIFYQKIKKIYIGNE